ncbi:DAK1 [Auxenochlorella protothecoides x Auxenochlorella symbiontica]
MAQQHFVNKIEELVQESLEGLIDSNPNLIRLDGYPHTKVVYDRNHDASKVAVISGGGSGHEPAMAGYVGAGMLAAAVAGDVFASPSEDAVLAAIRAVGGPAGVVLIVMNYTGDRLNFGAAAERAKVEGIPVDMVIVADDVAPIEGGTVKNRRGIAGTVLVHKVAGAAAAEGRPMAEVASAARGAAAALASMGCSLSTCNVPGAPPSDRLAAGEMEMGLGIHGEPGAYKTALAPLDQIVGRLVGHLADAGALDAASPRAVLLVNNLGGSTPLEVGAAASSAVRVLRGERGVALERVLVGTFMTSLAMHGLSLTVLVLGDDGEEVLRRLDAPTAAPAWPRTGAFRGAGRVAPLPVGTTDAEAETAPGAAAAPLAAGPAADGLAAVAAALKAARPELDALDGKVGDGDCGSTLARGAEAALRALRDGGLRLDGGLGAAGLALGRVLGGAMGGTSGAIYKLVFTAAGAELGRREGGGKALGPADFGAALEAGAAAASKYGGAEEGDRTMLCALWPAARALQAGAASPAEAVAEAAAAARRAADATAAVEHAGAGRSAYVRGELLKGVADPGAVGVARWLEALVPVLGGK